MHILKAATALTGLAVLVGCSAMNNHPASYIKQPTVCIDKKWYGYYQGSGCPSMVKAAAPDASQEMAARLASLERERQRLADDLEAARRQNGALSSRVSDLERQLADRDREIAALRSGADDQARLSSQLSAARGDVNQLQNEKERLAAELAAARLHMEEHDRLTAELESQLAGARQRIADLEGLLDQSKGSLARAERDLLKALQPEISKGTVSVNQAGDALTINLASSLLFDSGQGQLKARGADALQRVGGVLKGFPEKQVHVAGYTDNVAIKGALQKKFPSNKELSDARAESAAAALRSGGVTNLTAAGHGESDPIASNNTAAGRAKNRRVEVVVK
ncbi:MAG: OmpA family protein [Nitrospira sp.]|nr:OmpA family protein [Nitrospira sp.]